MEGSHFSHDGMQGIVVVQSRAVWHEPSNDCQVHISPHPHIGLLVSG